MLTIYDEMREVRCGLRIARCNIVLNTGSGYRTVSPRRQPRRRGRAYAGTKEGTRLMIRKGQASGKKPGWMRGWPRSHFRGRQYNGGKVYPRNVGTEFIIEGK